MIDASAIERSLCVDGWMPLAPPEWLAQSWREPASFWDDLAAWHDASGLQPLKSAPFARYDLFHDLVLRNLAVETPALTWYDAAGERRGLGYRALAVAAARRAEAWRRSGAVAGQPVAIVRPFGRELVVSLLAAVKLGLQFSLVPSGARRLVRARLAALGEAHVDLDERDEALLPDGVRALARETAGDGALELERSHAYQPGEPLALLFDPAASSPAVPRPLSCDAAFLGALRDATVALGLRRGDALAAPGLPLLSTQPSLIFAALVAGASFVQLDLAELERAPERLTDRPLRTVGVTPQLRELVRRHALSVGARWASWFRDPLASPLLEPWSEFVAVAGLTATPAMNLRWDAALGGCTLFSARRRGRAHCEVLPAAGVSWSVVDLVQDDVVAAAGAGRLAIVPPGHAEPAVTPAIVLPQGRGFLCGGTLPARPGGRAYPAADALAAIATVESCRAATVVLDPGGADGLPSVTLLVFTAGAKEPAEAVAAAVRGVIADELGDELQPDRIECFPLFPRRDDAGATDARWCHGELRAGGLRRKSADELHRLLSRLRERVVPQNQEPRP